MLVEFVLADQTVPVVDQVMQKIEDLWFDRTRDSIAPEFVNIQIQFTIAELIYI